jgi:hypothetical protein
MLWPIRFQCGGVWIATDPLQMYVGDHMHTAFRLVPFHPERNSCKSGGGGRLFITFAILMSGQQLTSPLICQVYFNSNFQHLKH